MDWEKIKQISWFGGSWGLGVELEKDSPLGLGIDQQAFVQDHRYTGLVCKHFDLVENNMCQQGISSEMVVKNLASYVDSLSTSRYENEFVLIVWPNDVRYYWIDNQGQDKHLRISDQSWFELVDNLPYRDYCLQRSLWSCNNYLRNKGINYAMIHGEYQEPLHSHKHYHIDQSSWLTLPHTRMSDWLDFDLDLGYPSAKQKHQFFWPCEHHPNRAGHMQIANKLIQCIESKILKKELK